MNQVLQNFLTTGIHTRDITQIDDEIHRMVFRQMFAAYPLQFIDPRSHEPTF